MLTYPFSYIPHPKVQDLFTHEKKAVRQALYNNNKSYSCIVFLTKGILLYMDVY